MTFVKKYSWILIYMFTHSVAAQTDSTDISFYSGIPTPVSFEDSLLIAGGGLVDLTVAFTMDDESYTAGKIWVELMLIPGDQNAILLAHDSYTLAELETAFLLSGQNVTIPLGRYADEMEYEVAIRLEDTDGNQVRLITKRLEQ